MASCFPHFSSVVMQVHKALIGIKHISLSVMKKLRNSENHLIPVASYDKRHPKRDTSGTVPGFTQHGKRKIFS